MGEQFVGDGSGRAHKISVPDDVAYEGEGVVEAFMPEPMPEPAPEPGDGGGPFVGGDPSDGGADSTEAGNDAADESVG